MSRTLTLAQAQAGFQAALAALQRAENATGYSAQDISVQRARLESLRSSVAWWEKQIAELSASPTARNPGYAVPKFR